MRTKSSPPPSESSDLACILSLRTVNFDSGTVLGLVPENALLNTTSASRPAAASASLGVTTIGFRGAVPCARAPVAAGKITQPANIGMLIARKRTDTFRIR
jgi:hypothetical protein